jgi:hypothetical protein
VRAIIQDILVFCNFYVYNLPAKLRRKQWHTEEKKEYKRNACQGVSNLKATSVPTEVKKRPLANHSNDFELKWHSQSNKRLRIIYGNDCSREEVKVRCHPFFCRLPSGSHAVQQ